jgi:hypothetical protein
LNRFHLLAQIRILCETRACKSETTTTHCHSARRIEVSPLYTHSRAYPLSVAKEHRNEIASFGFPSPPSFASWRSIESIWKDDATYLFPWPWGTTRTWTLLRLSSRHAPRMRRWRPSSSDFDCLSRMLPLGSAFLCELGRHFGPYLGNPSHITRPLHCPIF